MSRAIKCFCKRYSGFAKRFFNREITAEDFDEDNVCRVKNRLYDFICHQKCWDELKKEGYKNIIKKIEDENLSSV